MTASSQALARGAVSALRQRPKLTLVHDIDAPPAITAPSASILARTSAAINKAYTFTFIVAACTAIGIGCYVAGWNDKVMMTQNTAVIELQAAPLKAPMTPRAWNRITGERK